MPARGRHCGSTSTSVPFVEVGFYYHGRKLSDADAAQGRETQCHHVLGDEAWCVGDQRSGFVRAVEAPFMMLVRRSPADAWKLDKIGGNKRVAQSLQQHRRRHQPLRALGQHPHHQIVVFQWRKTHAQRDVDAIGDHVDPARRAFEMHRNVRTLGHEAGDHLADLEIQKRRRTTHANDTLRFAARALDQFLRRIGFHQHSDAMPIVVLSDLGDAEAPGRTLDQPHPEPVLQHCDAAAQSRTRHAQRAGGGGKTAMIDHLNEEIQIVEILHHRLINRTVMSDIASYRVFVPPISSIATAVELGRVTEVHHAKGTWCL